MKANLSLILDKEGNIRIDLLSNQELVDIDKYTASKSSHTDVREDYQEIIDNFLKEQESFTSTFKRDSNKKGSIVVTFLDEVGKLRKMRVLYSDNTNKLNASKVLTSMINELKKINDFSITEGIVEKYKYSIFTSQFDKDTLYNSKRNVSYFRNKADFLQFDSVKKENKKLISFVNNKLKYLLGHENPHYQNIGYYYIRLLDAHIDKAYGIKTTPKIVPTKTGLIKAYESNLDTAAKETVQFVKDNQLKQIINEPLFFNEQEINQDDNGQLSFIVPKPEIKPRIRHSDLLIELEEMEDIKRK